MIESILQDLIIALRENTAELKLSRKDPVGHNDDAERQALQDKRDAAATAKKGEKATKAEGVKSPDPVVEVADAAPTVDYRKEIRDLCLLLVREKPENRDSIKAILTVRNAKIVAHLLEVDLPTVLAEVKALAS